MSNQRLFDKIDKATAKKKSEVVIKAMHKADNEILIKALDALGQIADEESCNQLSHFFDHEDGGVRLAACKAALAVNTEYMKTRVRHQLAMEKDPAVKADIQEAFNQAREK